MRGAVQGRFYKSFEVSLECSRRPCRFPGTFHSVLTARGSASGEGEVASGTEDRCGVSSRFTLGPAAANQLGLIQVNCNILIMVVPEDYGYFAECMPESHSASQSRGLTEYNNNCRSHGLGL